MRYEGKVTIVTGGAQGIGSGIVKVFVEEGSKVVVADIEDEAGQRFVEEMNALKRGEAFYIHCDVLKEEDVKNMISQTVAKYGRIDCLVNNAGILSPAKAIDNIQADEFMKVIGVNVIGPFLCSKYALPHLRTSVGNIVNLCSVSDVIAFPGALPYVTSKGGIRGLTLALAIDEACHGVRVNAVSPGSIMTALQERTLRESGNYEASRRIADGHALLGRLGQPEEIGKTVLYLAADATFSTGSIVLASGGAELGLARKSRVGLTPLDRYY